MRQKIISRCDLSASLSACLHSSSRCRGKQRCNFVWGVQVPSSGLGGFEFHAWKRAVDTGRRGSWPSSKLLYLEDRKRKCVVSSSCQLYMRPPEARRDNANFGKPGDTSVALFLQYVPREGFRVVTPVGATNRVNTTILSSCTWAP